MSEIVLDVRDLSVEFPVRRGLLHAVDGATFQVHRGEIVGVVGESGSGKSVTMMAVLGLVPPPGRVVSGEIRLGELDVRRADMSKLRGPRMALIPPDAGASLNPVVRIGKQVAEGLHAHQPGLSGAARRTKVADILERVGLPNPRMRMRRYPHELSGGMQQRVTIAMGVQLGPELLIADEPTTALDVTIQAQVLRLLLDIRAESGTAMLFITHDIAIVSEMCDRVIVMYAGRIVETGTVTDVCTHPAHPYTQALIDSLPPLGGEPAGRLSSIPGAVPDAPPWPTGCRFAERCWLRRELGDPARCTDEDPDLRSLDGGRQSGCHFAADLLGRHHEPAVAVEMRT